MTIRRWGAALVLASLVAVLLPVALYSPDGGLLRPAAAEVPRAADKPNIVVVMADDMRVDDLLFMPELRRLVQQQGTHFDNSFSNFPLCCPARASFLTGQYSHNHKVFSHVKPYGYSSFDDSRTLATSLQGAGYRTGFVGKYLNGYGLGLSKVSKRPSYTYVPRGWDDWRAAIEPPRSTGIPGGTYNYMSTPFNNNGRVDTRYRGRYQTNVLTDMSIDMTGSFAKSSKPFFLYLNYLAPHFGGPREADDPRPVRNAKGDVVDFKTPARPPWVRGRFDRFVKRAAGLTRSGKAEAAIGDQPEYYRKLREPTPRERRAMRELTRQRLESVFVMDQQIARLIAHLKSVGEWEDTVFMFTADNGYYLGEHRIREGKIRPHEPSFRVPFLVAGPGIRKGQRVSDPITTVDATASVLDLAGANAPKPADGTSRVTTMTTGDQGWTRPVLYEATHTQGRGSKSFGFRGPLTSIGIRTSRFAYVRNRAGGHMLYDLMRDPLQNENVFDNVRYRKVGQVLKRVWWTMRNCRTTGCRQPLPEPFATDATMTRALTLGYWRTVLKTYGFQRYPRLPDAVR